ncbi:MAG TPA: metallophosphoesterase family protein [Isosphaeraceae bacterium]|nr:metallophosphoesterase family protein [Isosphaeraceae bacterium]
MPQRTIAIGDIHGCSVALATLIDAVDPGLDDLIIMLGDYVDRGIDSRGVIDQLLALGQRCRLIPLLGNHDEMLLDSLHTHAYGRLGPDPNYRAWLEFGGVATLQSYGADESLQQIPLEHVAFLEGCREFYETNTHLFVHASYDARRPMEEQPPELLRWQSLRDRLPGPHTSGKVAVVGHTAQKGGEVLDLGYLKCIDTYCYGGGWLTALEVDTGQLWQANERGEVR